MNNLHPTIERAIAPFIPPATQDIPRDAADVIERLHDEVCQLRMQVKSLRSEVAAGLPDVDVVEVTGNSDPQTHQHVCPDDEVREQIRAELYDSNAEWINERASELVKAERQQLAWDAADTEVWS